MGKSLTGKELGTGLSQRKDGTFSARILIDGKREEHYFKKLPEAKRWLNERRYKKEAGLFIGDRSTVDEWFEFWKSTIIRDRAPNTIRTYTILYNTHIRSVIGRMRIRDVKPMHCAVIFRNMEQRNVAGSTMRHVYTCIGSFFRSAVSNGKASSVPLDGIRITKPSRAPDDIRVLTVAEQKAFLEALSFTHNYAPYAFVLETGLRCGELTGLTWQDIDWDKQTLTVKRSLEHRSRAQGWRAGPPKSASGYRTIPLTQRAQQILKDIRATRRIPVLDTELEYIDRRTGQKDTVNLKDLVFINFRTGAPVANSTYDTYLSKLCRTTGLRPFSMHSLRHTFATRAIERGVQPKVLQRILGHSSISMTMDRYVHVTEDSLAAAFQTFETQAI